MSKAFFALPYSSPPYGGAYSFAYYPSAGFGFSGTGGLYSFIFLSLI